MRAGLTCSDEEPDESIALRGADLWMRAAEAYFEHADYDACLSAAGHAENLRRPR